MRWKENLQVSALAFCVLPPPKKLYVLRSKAASVAQPYGNKRKDKPFLLDALILPVWQCSKYSTVNIFDD